MENNNSLNLKRMFKVIDQNEFKDLKYYGNTVLLGDTIYNLTGTILTYPTRTSIQIGPSQHIEDDQGKYINHSCDPSVRVVGNKLIGVKQINNGDSITFDYNETEDTMSNPFTCHCCGEEISGKLV